MTLQSLENIPHTAIDPKDLKIRKKIQIYCFDKNSILLFIEQKSRFLQKDVEKIEDIFIKTSQFTNITFTNKYIQIEAPLCSKAKTKLENLNWEVTQVKL